ncbi:hypothetical protein DFO55_12421 [Grimontella sp. AG753]|nr:hypothetical protein DFO55_12421 [Grimontella sp. AG753]
MKANENQLDTKLYHELIPEAARYKPSKRGEFNSLRKGLSKIHRRYTPAFDIKKQPRGIEAQLFACIRNHDWNRNQALIALRQKGYTPFSRQFDPSFKPQPRRLGVRSESREALTAMHFALAANCDFTPGNQYMFEITVPFEDIARQMGVLHQYESGRIACDVAYHALRVTEEMGQAIVVREFDRDSRQYKPMRIFLTVEFFTSKGITLDHLKTMLTRFQAWTRKHGLTQSLKERNERHLLRLERLNLTLEKRHTLKNLLKRIKWQVTSPELIKEKQKVVSTLQEAIEGKEPVPLRSAPGSKALWFQFVNSGRSMPIITTRLEAQLSKEQPALRQADEEQFYRLLLERAGVGL